MPIVHLIEGPVGAGKSTFAVQLAASNGGVHIALDEWFANLFSSDRSAGDFASWYLERKERLLNLIWTHSLRLLASGKDVILELGLIQRQGRIDFCRQVLNDGQPLVVYILDAPHSERRERVRRRNLEKGATFSMVVPDHIFEIASRLWEPPDDCEHNEFQIEFVTSSKIGG